MKNHVSLLIGSGFSMPAGMPGVWKVNQKLSNVQPGDVWIHTDMRAGFVLEGQNDLNRRLKEHDHLFLEFFTRHYVETELESRGDFNYEKFYDFFTNPSESIDQKLKLDKICQDFNADHPRQFGLANDTRNMLASFERTYAQLIASMLSKPEYYANTTAHFSGTHPQYSSFIRLLVQLLAQDAVIDIHTLNHDLLLEYMLGNTQATSLSFSDGYTMQGSEYYGEIYRPIKVHGEFSFNNHDKRVQYVKLSKYKTAYHRPIRLYKLHGSIDLFEIRLKRSGPPMSPDYVKREYGMGEFFTDDNSNAPNWRGLESVHHEVMPLFLSGTTNKRRSYNQELIAKLHDYFRQNLKHSRNLIIIGYGFADDGINEYIQDYFIRKSVNIVVIDPSPKPAIPELWLPYVKHYQVGIDQLSEVQVDEILKSIEIEDLRNT